MILSLLKRGKKRRQHSLDVGNRLMPVKLNENRRAKRLTLRIEPGGGALKVTLPPHVGDDELAAFLDRNRNWVETRIARIPQKTALDEGIVIPYRGQPHRIIHVDRTRGVVEAREINGEACLLVPGDRAHLPRKLISFFKAEARKELDRAVVFYCGKLGVRARTIRITDTTSRWGSCSSNRTLSFSWRIILAPSGVLEYLAAHEVAHLREMNHSDRFWALVREISPQMEQHKAWLKAHGNKLHCIDIG